MLERIGIKTTKAFVYTVNLEKKLFDQKTIKTYPPVVVKKCTLEDIDQIPDEIDTTGFQDDLKHGHILVAAYSQDDIVGYVWLSCERKVYVSELENWRTFPGGYMWRGYTKEELRGKRIGQKIANYALSIAKENCENKKVFAIVELDNFPAQRALESLGFKKQSMVSYFKFLNIERRRERQVAMYS